MVLFLKDPDTVKKWAGLSLDARAVMLHRQFPEIHISGCYIG